MIQWFRFTPQLAEAVGRDDAHADRDDTDEGEKQSLFHAVELAEVETDIAEDEHVADGQLVEVVADRL